MEDEVTNVPTPAEELKKRQRAFIPINIITCVLALVAGLTLLFTPFLSFDMGELILAAQREEGDYDDDYASMNEEDVAIYLAASSGDLKLSFTPFDFATIASDENPVITFAKTSFVDNGLFEDAFTAGVGAGMVVVLGLGDGTDIAKEELANLDLEELSSFIKTAETDEEAARKEFKQSAIKIAQTFDLQLADDFDAQADKAFDEIVQEGKATPDSQFSMEYFVCSTISKGTSETEKPITANSYEELAEYFANEYMPLEESDVATFKLICWVVFGIVTVPAIMWLLLALLSGFHILLKNKTFLTWYVKLTGFFPCLLFGVIPLLVSLFADSVQGITAVCGALSTMTWISGACFIALAILSVAFIYPRRNKIRALRRSV